MTQGRTSPKADWHIVTCEYPPTVGGVADYTRTIACGLARTGRQIDVWCPARGATDDTVPGVRVRPDLGRFSPADLRGLDAQLDRAGAPVRLLVQWVPHGFGYRSVNLGFARWLARRAVTRGDELHVMVHEPYLRFSPRPARFVAAAVHRLMLATVCRHASRVWLSIPTWKPMIRRYVPRQVPIEVLPVPSPELRRATPMEIETVRARIAPDGQPTVGHFGTYTRPVVPLVTAALDEVLNRSNASVLLIGHGSDAFRTQYLAHRSAWASRVHATGMVDADGLGAQLDACDVLVQPYPDGISGRRTSALTPMSLGRPLVSNLGALSEAFWRDEHAVAVVGRPDGTQVGSRAIALLSDDSGRRRLGGAAREVYDQTFDVRHAVALLEASARG